MGDQRTALLAVTAAILAAGAGAWLLWGGATSPPPPGPSPRNPVPDLAELADRLLGSRDPYYGTLPGIELRNQLAALGAGGSPVERMRTLYALAQWELHNGRTAEALPRYEEALAIGRTLGSTSDCVTILLDLATLHLKNAEVADWRAHYTPDTNLFPVAGEGVHDDPTEARRAIEALDQLLALAPDSLKAIWLLNLAHMMIGTYPDGVPAQFRIPASAWAGADDIPRFPNIAPQLGLSRVNHAGGAILDDFDNDGRLDVVMSSCYPTDPMAFLWNRGDGRLVDATAGSGLEWQLGGLNITSTDYNNDGLLDVYVLRGGWMRKTGRQRNSLLRNNGDRTFTDVTWEAGLGEYATPTHSAAWADFDNDGDLDAYVANECYPEPDEQFAGQLFRNNRNGTFTDVAAAAGVENLRYAKGATAGDYDNDGDADLYISNYGEWNRLYRNNGDGTFTDVAESAGVREPRWSFACWFWDYDNDGRLDLYVNSFGPDIADVAADLLGRSHQADRTRLFRNTGDGRFADVSRDAGVHRTMMPMSANFGDLDNDGWLDFYLGTGFPRFDAIVPNRMFRNREGREFVDVTAAGGFGLLQKGHGIGFGDIDNDGDQDVWIEMGGFYLHDGFYNALFLNPGNANHWVTLKLVGTHANRMAVGARIRVDVRRPGGGTRSIHAHVSSGGSFGCGSLQQEIGLGDAEAILAVEILWPGSGARETLRDVPIDRFIEIREGDGAARVVDRARVPFSP